MTAPGTALIVGAAGAIGAACAVVLARQGYRLALADLDADRLQSSHTPFPDADRFAVDATDPVAMSDLFARLAPHQLSAVVLCAGIEGPVGKFEDCAEADFDRVMHVNVKSVWLGIKESLTIMKPQGYGSIVALASISGVIATPMMAAYTCSKHAVLGLVKTAAREAAPHGVRVNAVCPAPVDSAMMSRIDAALGQNFPQRLGGRQDATKSVPMQRYARLDEVAQMVAFLCSDASSFSTGCAHMVDGGITCR